MLKRGLALLVALVVGTVVIYAGVTLYHLRDELFRPDVNKVGGTEVVLEIEQEPNADAAEKARRVLHKRFDERGSGVEVRLDGVKHLAVVVPNSRRHDTIVGQVRRLGPRRGRVEFRMVAQTTFDKDAMELAETKFLAMKDVPAKLGEAGEELVVGVGAAAKRYRWFSLSDGQAQEWLRYGPARGGPVKARHDRWTEDSGFGHVRLFGVDRGAGSAAYFVLCVEPDPADRIGGEGIEQVRPAGLDHNHTGRLEITFSEELAERLRRLTGPYLSSPRTTRPDEHYNLACVLDGQVVFASDLYQPIKRKQTFAAHVLPSDVEDLAAMLRGGELAVTINPMRMKENVVAPRR